MTAMTPELTDELEVEFVLWEAEDPFSRPCERSGLDCPNVAVYRVFWGPDERVGPESQDQCCNQSRLCLDCFYVLTQVAGTVECSRCLAADPDGFYFKRIKFSEPLSRG